MKVRKFIFYIPEYVTHSNGIKVLYEAAWLFSKFTSVEIINYAHSGIEHLKKIPLRYKRLIKAKITNVDSNTIFVFPESLIDDPIPNLEKKVVRYFLSKPYILNGCAPRFENDYCLSYSNLISNKLPQLFLLDPEILAITESIPKKNYHNKKALIYFGKIRPNQFYINKKLFELINCFHDVKIITRSIPRNRKVLHAEIANADIVISLDPLTSLIHESLLLGTPCLIIDSIFKNEYKNFNIKFYNLYYASDIKHLIKIFKSNHKIKNYKIKNIKTFKTALKVQDRNVSKSINLIGKNINKIDYKKNLSLNSIFYDFYIKKWGSEQVMNCTSINSIIYQWIFFDNNYLFNKLYKLYRDIRSNSWISALTFFKLNIFNITISKNLFFGFLVLIKIHLFKKLYSDMEILKLLRR